MKTTFLSYTVNLPSNAQRSTSNVQRIAHVHLERWALSVERFLAHILWAVQQGTGLILLASLASLLVGPSPPVVLAQAPPTYYVDAASANPVHPYTNWANAARTIQEAIDAGTAPERLVLVTNGVYRDNAKYRAGWNRIALTNAVVVRSVNGPEGTVVEGAPPTAAGRDDACRCAYVGADAVLDGFTLRKGERGQYYNNGGGAFCEPAGVLTNCVLIANSAVSGGGVCGGTLYNCLLTANSAGGGGGAHEGTLYNCRLIGNSAVTGGGAAGGILRNCVLNENKADQFGGGVYGGTLYNCTLTGNSAGVGGGGVARGTLRNCLVYFNEAPGGANHVDSSLQHSCTTPRPNGPGNIDVDPGMVSATHLSATSPCLGAGDRAAGSGLDIDGEAWADPPAIGADQFWPGQSVGLLSLHIAAGLTVFHAGFPVAFRAESTGRITRIVWDFGDGTVVSNRPYVDHHWIAPGLHTVRLTGYNDSHPEGVTVTLDVQVVDAVYYVNAANPNPIFPYASWATAATTIQDAIRVGLPTVGKLVLVTNGVYRTGSVEAQGPTRVTLTNAIVQSVNGPVSTVIDGGGTVRCAYLGTNAVLSGFTLRNGRATFGGAVLGEARGVVTNCVLAGNTAQENGGGAYRCTVLDSTLRANSARSGGGAAEATLRRCALNDNSASTGGGVAGGVLDDCVVSGNTANWNGGGCLSATLLHCTLTGNQASSGGGTSGGTLSDCMLSGNSAASGGGASGGTLSNCRLTGNWASSGGGAESAELHNCIVTANSAADSGAGTMGGTLYNCTLTGNSAFSGGGAVAAALYNCLVYWNRAPNNANWESSTFEYCCTTPRPEGPGNFDADPQLASTFRPASTSPCLGRGFRAYASGFDIDGEPWADPPAIGADQVWPGQPAGTLTLQITADYSQAAPTTPLSFAAEVSGPLTRSVWDFGDGTLATNRPYIRHAWAAAGQYTVRLTGYNDSHPEGVSTTIEVQVVEAIHYVNVVNPSPVFPFTTWATAATNIQAAANASTVAGRLVLVTNGIYQSGTTMVIGANRVALTNVTLRSVNGPDVTIIDGTGEARCVYLGGSAVVSGFMLRNGKADLGGGVCSAHSGVVTNCIVTNATGGGAYRGTFYNCTLTQNLGGGASEATLYDCTLSGNRSEGPGGGAADATLVRCLLTGNRAQGQGGGACNCTLSYCTLSGNRVDGDSHSMGMEGMGGGAFGGVLYNCVLSGNTANRGGGVAGTTSFSEAPPCTLHNCTLTGNSARDQGGGAWRASLYNCTVTANSAQEWGGGVAGGTLYNCVVYFNLAGYEPNWGSSRFPFPFSANWVTEEPDFQYSCTFPLPPGPGNISVDPQLASATHLASRSPCLGAGNPEYASGLDIDGEPWASPPAIGSDQVGPGPSTGPLTVRIEVPFTRFATGFAVQFTGDNTGPILRSVWDFGDGTVVTNQPFLRHAWVAPGTYSVRFTGYNDDHPEGVTASVEVEVIDAVHYVNLANPTPVFPYTTWATAATNIQDAIDAGGELGRLVLVTNGVYRSGTISAWSLAVRELADLPSLAGKLKHPTREVDKWLAGQLSPATKAALGAYEGQGSDPTALQPALVGDLNRILSGSSIYSERRFAGVELRPVTAELLGLAEWELRLNRLLIEDAYPAEISKNSATESLGLNRVALRNPVVVRSVNGPDVTVLDGSQQDPKTGAVVNVRCAYVGNESVLSGFTLTKGAGGVFCAASGIVTNCVLSANSAEGGGGAYGGALYNCTLSDNSASGRGGGAYRCTLYDCVVRNNTAGWGGGADRCTLYDCVVRNNTAGEGGGVYGSTLRNCVVERNSAPRGGGASSDSFWGRAFPCTLYNCTVTGNTAEDVGGGVQGCTLYNCTLTGNSAQGHGGGVDASRLYNCLVYFNHAPQEANCGASELEYCCTAPLPPGPGNISTEPQLVSATHLSLTSPCLGAGNPAYASGVDIDGEPWANPPAIGADQVWPGQSVGPLTVQLEAELTQFAIGFPVWFSADITGRITRSVWDFGDGVVATNQWSIRHAWSAPGTYSVRLTGYNDDHPEGVTSSVEVEVVEVVYYVDLANLTPVFPYTTWATAATNIQDAIDAGSMMGRLVLVTNGVYRTGGVTANGLNRVALTSAVVVRSVNGPAVTVIEGTQQDPMTGAGVNCRCAYVGDHSVLSGFTLTKGGANDGGGAACAPLGVLTNCTLVGNTARYAGGANGGTLHACTVTGNAATGDWVTGGGAHQCTLYNCAVTGNTTAGSGGGVVYSTLYNCAVTGNTAAKAGGGVFDSALYNCTVTGNTAKEAGGGIAYGSAWNTLVYLNQAPSGVNWDANQWSPILFVRSCTTPLPQGLGNIDADPGFVDATAGDFRLRYGSPCIDAGAVEASTANDLAGLPRPLDGNGDGVALPDMGAYELDLRTIVPAEWLVAHGLDATDPQILSGNPDEDGQTNFQEWMAGTDPRDPLSFFRIEALDLGPPVTAFYRSVIGRVYSLYAAHDLANGATGGTVWAPLPGQIGVPGTGGLDSLVDTNAPPRRFYRVGVDLQ